MELLYSTNIRWLEADAMSWNPSTRDIFEVKTFYNVLQFGLESCLEIQSPLEDEFFSLDSSVGEGANDG